MDLFDEKWVSGFTKAMKIGFELGAVGKVDLFKAWSKDLGKRFPGGGWRTINGARVFIDKAGKVVAGLGGFNDYIDNFFKDKKGSGSGQKDGKKSSVGDLKGKIKDHILDRVAMHKRENGEFSSMAALNDKDKERALSKKMKVVKKTIKGQTWSAVFVEKTDSGGPYAFQVSTDIDSGDIDDAKVRKNFHGDRAVKFMEFMESQKED